jgi:mannitol-specific phosphotransferase system IIBC component
VKSTISSGSHLDDVSSAHSAVIVDFIISRIILKKMPRSKKEEVKQGKKASNKTKNPTSKSNSDLPRLTRKQSKEMHNTNDSALVSDPKTMTVCQIIDKIRAGKPATVALPTSAHNSNKSKSGAVPVTEPHEPSEQPQNKLKLVNVGGELKYVRATEQTAE